MVTNQDDQAATACRLYVQFGHSVNTLRLALTHWIVDYELDALAAPDRPAFIRPEGNGE
jgi:hypothetical protein